MATTSPINAEPISPKSESVAFSVWLLVDGMPDVPEPIAAFESKADADRYMSAYEESTGNIWLHVSEIPYWASTASFPSCIPANSA